MQVFGEKIHSPCLCEVPKSVEKPSASQMFPAGDREYVVIPAILDRDMGQHARDRACLACNHKQMYNPNCGYIVVRVLD